MTSARTAVELTQDLVAFPTISLTPNLELIDYVTEYLDSFGARIQVSYSPDRKRANLFAGFGPDVDGGVVLSGHTDVVPARRQEWEFDPFDAVEHEGRLYGRGACDVKGFLGCVLATAPRIAAADLKSPIHLAFTYDEEVACLGAGVLLDRIARSGPTPRAAIVGEPTRLRIIEAHKGCWEFTTEFSGRSGHGSQPARAVNAVEYASRYVTRLIELAREMQTKADADSPFDPPHTSISVGRIRGGIGRNVVAGECTIEWEMRPVRPADGDYVLSRMTEFVEAELLPEMRRVHPAASIATHTIGAVRGLAPDQGSEARSLMEGILDAPESDVVSFGTEAGLYQDAGISAVVWGPGDIEQAHTSDEYVEIEQLEGCLVTLERLVRALED